MDCTIISHLKKNSVTMALLKECNNTDLIILFSNIISQPCLAISPTNITEYVGKTLFQETPGNIIRVDQHLNTTFQQVVLASPGSRIF